MSVKLDQHMNKKNYTSLLVDKGKKKKNAKTFFVDVSLKSLQIFFHSTPIPGLKCSLFKEIAKLNRVMFLLIFMPFLNE